MVKIVDTCIHFAKFYYFFQFDSFHAFNFISTHFCFGLMHSPPLQVHPTAEQKTHPIKHPWRNHPPSRPTKKIAANNPLHSEYKQWQSRKVFLAAETSPFWHTKECVNDIFTPLNPFRFGALRYEWKREECVPAQGILLRNQRGDAAWSFQKQVQNKRKKGANT